MYGLDKYIHSFMLEQSIHITGKMSSVSASFAPVALTNQVRGKGLKVACRARFPCLRASCSAQEASAETVQKVCDIVKKQLALSEDTLVTPGSQFSELGADSLDTVEIVMNLEEEFGITVEEDNSQSITTVQEAANLIHRLVQTKA